MSNLSLTIAQLAAGQTPLTGAELVPIWQNGRMVQVSVNSITNQTNSNAPAVVSGGTLPMPTNSLVLVNNLSASGVILKWQLVPQDGETHKVVDYANTASAHNIQIQTFGGSGIYTISANGVAINITYSAALSGFALT